LHVNRLSGTSSDFTTAELWVCDPSHCFNWTETGWHNGHRCCGISGSGLSWFFAEDWEGTQGPGCDGSGYIEHYYPDRPVNLGETHVAKILYYENFRWQAYIDGVAIGTTRPCHFDWTQDMRTGTELTYDSAQITADASGLQKRTTSGSSYDWPGSFPELDGVSAPSFDIYWLNPYKSAAWYGN